MFENTDTMPYQIEEMKATIENQRQRLIFKELHKKETGKERTKGA